MGARRFSDLIQSPWVWTTVLIVSLLLRVPRLSQSLWYDEMLTLTDYVDGSWHNVLASQPGHYVPNNHVLHTILAKAVYGLGPRGELEGLGPSEALLRVPAVLAGALLPLALGWPLRRDTPWPALLLAILAAVHPWLLAFSTEARGYSLMLLLGVLATHALPDGRRRWPIGYALLMVGAIYTLPIALLLLPAHALVMVTLRRPATAIWARAAALALLLSFVLYFPLFAGIRQYYRHPYEASISYAELLNQLPRFAMLGERLPGAHGAFADRTVWAVPILLLAIGTPMGWRLERLRPLLLTMSLLTAVGVLLPIAVPAATEVRFNAWIAIWLCLAAVGLLVGRGWLRAVAAPLFVAALLVQDLRLPPHQPVREALQAADRLAPAGCDLMVGYLGSVETAYLYGPQQSHRVLFGQDAKQWLAAEATARRETGSNPWIVILYEDLLLRRLDEPETRGLWLHLQRDYDCVLRLPGRITPVAVYKPHDNGPPVACAPAREETLLSR